MQRKIQMKWLLYVRYVKCLNWRWPIKCWCARVASISCTDIQLNIFALKCRITLCCTNVSVAHDCYFSLNRMLSVRLNWMQCAFNATILTKLWIVEYSLMSSCHWNMLISISNSNSSERKKKEKKNQRLSDIQYVCIKWSELPWKVWTKL